MLEKKKARRDEINTSIKLKENNFKIGLWIYIKNPNRKSKFQLLYLEQPWIIESLDPDESKIHDNYFKFLKQTMNQQ